eukprot:2984895-Rhodomonas_salina.2
MDNFRENGHAIQRRDLFLPPGSTPLWSYASSKRTDIVRGSALRNRYAVSGTDVGYAGTRCAPATSSRCYPTTSPYAMSGTDIAYAACA